MSSAPARTSRLAGRALKGVVWSLLFAVLATGAAGLLDQASHAPGSPARAELTYAGDSLINGRLDAAGGRLTEISAWVERLADEAKSALEEIASADPERLRDSLQRGGQAASAIEASTAEVRAALAGLPGDGSTATLEYANATLVRRSAVLSAVDAASSLAGHWRQVAARATEVANLTTLIAEHDATVLQAAARGRDHDYARAIEILERAPSIVADVQALRGRLIAGSDGTVLDEWIERNREYDAALTALYAALEKSGDRLTPAVSAAYREHENALRRLPEDRRTIVVIVSEASRSGLTQAVLAIEDARARIDEALEEAVRPSSGPAAPSTRPTGTT
jgi:hypothetical protein